MHWDTWEQGGHGTWVEQGRRGAGAGGPSAAGVSSAAVAPVHPAPAPPPPRTLGLSSHGGLPTVLSCQAPHQAPCGCSSEHGPCSAGEQTPVCSGGVTVSPLRTALPSHVAASGGPVCGWTCRVRAPRGALGWGRVAPGCARDSPGVALQDRGAEPSEGFRSGLCVRPVSSRCSGQGARAGASGPHCSCSGDRRP